METDKDTGELSPCLIMQLSRFAQLIISQSFQTMETLHDLMDPRGNQIHSPHRCIILEICIVKYLLM